LRNPPFALAESIEKPWSPVPALHWARFHIVCFRGVAQLHCFASHGAVRMHTVRSRQTSLGAIPTYIATRLTIHSTRPPGSGSLSTVNLGRRRVNSSVRRHNMLATVQALRVGGQSCEARSGNDILFVFPVPSGANLHLGDVIELNPFALNQPQIARNVTTEQSIQILLSDNNVHDLRLSSAHGTSRTPSSQRLRGA